MSKTSMTDADDAVQIREDNEDWHDKEADLYDKIRSELWNFFEQRRISRDLDVIDELAPDDHAYDVGCGTGNLVLKLLNMGYEVQAVDISEEMLNVLRGKIDDQNQDNINFHNGGADEFLNKNIESPSVISFSSVLHHLPDYYETLDKAFEKLKPGGLLYVVHEPLPTKIDDKSTLRYLDKILTPRASLEKWQAPEKESDHVDYHIDSEAGIALEKLHEFFNSKGATIITDECYSTWMSGMLSALDQTLNLTKNTDFKILVRKPQPNSIL